MGRLRWFGLLTVLLLAIGGWYFLNKGVAVKAVTVNQADLIQYVQATGKVQAKQEHTMFAQTTGELLHLYVKAGDFVKENQVLAEMDPLDTRYKLQQLELQRQQVQADWDKMQEGPKPDEVKVLEENVHQHEMNVDVKTREWNRVKQEYDMGAVPKVAWQQKEDELKLAQSALNAARHQLALLQQGPSASDAVKYQAKIKELQLQQDQLKQDLLDMRIVAKQSGTITDLPVEEGQLVTKGTELLTVADLSELEIVSNVKETLISQVYVNQEAIIEGAALGNEQVAARVIKIDSVAKPASPTQDKKAVVAVTLALENGNAKLLPGYNVDVLFISNQAKAALQVPIGAVKRDDDGSYYVWMVRDSRAVRVPIETGIKNEMFIEVKKGLEAGNQVIVNVPDSLKDQQKVTLNP